MSGERRTGTQGSRRAKILESMYSDRSSSGTVGNLVRRGYICAGNIGRGNIDRNCLRRLAAT